MLTTSWKRTSTRVGPMVLAVALLAMAPVAAVDAAGAGPHQADMDAIKVLFSKFNEAANDFDVRAIGPLFADDADFISVVATTVHGRAAIEQHIRQLFAGPGKHIHRVAALREIRFLTPNTAMLYGDTETTGMPAQGGSATAQVPGFYDWVLMKEHGRWRIAVWHECDVPRRATAGAAPARAGT